MTAPALWGQWNGVMQDADSRKWLVVLNVDQARPYTGRILMADEARLEIWQHAILDNISGFPGKIDARIEFCDYPFRFEGDEKEYAETAGTFSGRAEGRLTHNELTLTLTMAGPARTRGIIRLARIERQSDSAAGKRVSWRRFRDWIESQPRGSESPWIFRGQSDADWPLLTAFHRHRAGRRDLIRFTADDAARLAAALGRVMRQPYRLEKRADYEALFSVAQHHGYPTPLLDWTESAYIAAYFALRRHRDKPKSERCRVYAFNATQFSQLVMSKLAAFEAPFLSLYTVAASRRDHERAEAQQSVFMLSNVSDIEAFVNRAEQCARVRFLMKFDLPTGDARHALADLRRMGITRASLFGSGVQSSRFGRACRTLRGRFERGG